MSLYVVRLSLHSQGQAGTAPPSEQSLLSCCPCPEWLKSQRPPWAGPQTISLSPESLVLTDLSALTLLHAGTGRFVYRALVTLAAPGVGTEIHGHTSQPPRNSHAAQSDGRSTAAWRINPQEVSFALTHPNMPRAGGPDPGVGQHTLLLDSTYTGLPRDRGSVACCPPALIRCLGVWLIPESTGTGREGHRTGKELGKEQEREPDDATNSGAVRLRTEMSSLFQGHTCSQETKVHTAEEPAAHGRYGRTEQVSSCSEEFWS